MLRRNIKPLQLRMSMTGIHCRFTLDMEHFQPGAR
jgi:hypothetical protein